MDNTVVVNGVTYYRNLPKQGNYEEKYECLVADLKDHIRDAEAIYKEFKELGLTFNTIEAEGYLRSAKTIEDIMGRVEKYMSDI